MTQIDRFDFSNKPQSNLSFNYKLSRPNTIVESSIELFSRLQNRSLITRFIITPDLSFQNISVIDELTYAVGTELKYNRLLFRKIFGEISTRYNLSNGFILLDEIENPQEFLSTSYNFNLIIKRTTKSGYGIEFNSDLSFIQFNFNDDTNIRRFYNIGLSAYKGSDTLRFKYALSLQNISLEESYFFNDFNMEYRFPKSKWTLNLDVLNLFDVRFIQSRMITEISVSDSAYSLPGIRGVIRASYNF